MKTYLISALLTFTLVTTGLANAGEKVKHSLKVPMSGSVFIKSTRGLIQIEGWDKPEIQLSGELDDSAEKLIFKVKGHKTLIKVKMNGKSHWGDGTNLKIFMPRSHELYFKGIDTTFHINNISADVEGKTFTGDVQLTNIHSEIEVSTVSGAIKLEKSSGEAQIESVSGDINFSGVFEDTYIKSMAGTIDVTVDNIENLLIKNISGDTLVKGKLSADAEVELSSVSGDIHYKTTDELNAQCEISSYFGGDIMNMLTDDVAEEKMHTKKNLSFVSGDGSANITMKTVTGSVYIEKQ